MAQSGQSSSPRICNGSARTCARALSSAAFFLEETDCTHLLFWDADVGGSDPTARGVLRARADGMLGRRRRICAPYRASESCGTKFGRSTSTTRIPGAASTGSRRTGRILGRKARVAGAPSVRADQARGCGQGRVRCFANGETFTDWCEGKQQLRRLLSSCS